MGFVVYEIVSLLLYLFLFLDLRGSRALKSKKDGMTMSLVVASFTFYLIFSFIVNLEKVNLLTFSPNLGATFNFLFDLSIVLFILLWTERIIRSLSKKAIYLIIIACEVALLLIYLFLMVNYLYPTFNLNQGFQVFSFKYGLYLLSFYYILNGTVVLLRRFRLINRQTVLLLLFSHLIFIISLTTYFLFDSNHLLTISSAFLLFGSHLFLQQIQLNTDTLTLVPNQNAFILKLDDLMRTKRHATLLVADIENFRQINEQYGIASGDIILKEFAQYLANLDNKGSIYRIMGNRFVLTLPIQKHNHLVRLVGSIKEKSATGWLVGSSVITFHTNIAIVEIPYHAFSKAKTLEIIEFTLNEIKIRRRQAVLIYNKKMEQLQQRKLDVLTAVRNAINDESRVLVNYQPLYETNSLELKTAEALMRIEDPLMGIISPAEFIPAAEQAGLITKLTEIILSKVCKFIAENKSLTDKLLYISINVSADDLVNLEMTRRLLSIIESYSIPYEKIGFEITESMIVNYDSLKEEVWNLLYEKGVKLLLDDFGTGYSNLEALINIPFDIVKIDRSVISSVQNNYKMASFIALMLTELEKKIVAEGVENEEQLTFLTLLGVDYLQGFYFSKPLSEYDFTKLLGSENEKSQSGA